MRPSAILFALFVVFGSIVEARAEDECRNITDFVQKLEQSKRSHTVVKLGQLAAFMRFFEESGYKFEFRPDYAVVVPVPERELMMVAFGELDKLCVFFVLPAAVARRLMADA